MSLNTYLNNKTEAQHLPRISVSYLTHTDNRIIYNLPLGKPNKNEPLNNTLNDQRTRTCQEAVKGLSNCWYYASNRLRIHYGKNSDPIFSVHRNIELIFSTYRKERNYIDGLEKYTNGFFKMIANGIADGQLPNISGDYDFKELLLRSSNMQSLPNFDRYVLDIPDLFSSFVKQFEDPITKENLSSRIADFNSFIENEIHNRKFDLVLNTLTNKLDVIPVLALAEKVGLIFNGLGLSTIEQLGEAREMLRLRDEVTINLLEATLKQTQFQKIGLEKSSWNPTKSIDVLLNELKAHGPHKVSGYLGSPFYKTNPFALSEKIEGHTIFGWKKGEYKGYDGITLHAVILVGAEKINGQENVYFVDPLDPSDPADPTTQIIYKMSYERFKVQVKDSWNGDIRILSEEITSNPNYIGIPMEKRGYLLSSKHVVIVS